MNRNRRGWTIAVALLVTLPLVPPPLVETRIPCGEIPAELPGVCPGCAATGGTLGACRGPSMRLPSPCQFDFLHADFLGLKGKNRFRWTTSHAVCLQDALRPGRVETPRGSPSGIRTGESGPLHPAPPLRL